MFNDCSKIAEQATLSLCLSCVYVRARMHSALCMKCTVVFSWILNARLHSCIWGLQLSSAGKISWKGGTISSCTMLNWMRQWDGSNISDFWQQSRAFLWLPLFSNNNTTEVSGKVFLMSTSNVVKTAWRPGLRPGPHWGSLQRSRGP